MPVPCWYSFKSKALAVPKNKRCYLVFVVHEEHHGFPVFLKATLFLQLILSVAQLFHELSFKCCVIYINIIILGHILNIVYLCQCLGLGQITSYICDIIFISVLFSLSLIIHNLIKTDALGLCLVFKIPPIIFGW